MGQMGKMGVGELGKMGGDNSTFGEEGGSCDVGLVG